MQTRKAEETGEQLRSRLSELPGVQSVDTAGLPKRLTIRCDPVGLLSLGLEAARRLVRESTDQEIDVNIELTSSPTRSRRARYVSVQTGTPEPGRLQATAVLEWQDQSYEGVADELATPPGELRGCAAATLRAVERIIGDGEIFTLIGVKEIRVFDHDLVAVLINSRLMPQKDLVGTAINQGDRKRAAALAVLNATNRAVSKFTDPEDRPDN